jgi:hypothetical protein
VVVDANAFIPEAVADMPAARMAVISNPINPGGK